MNNMKTHFAKLLIVILSLFSSGMNMVYAQENVTVTPETFIRAETDKMFQGFVKNARGEINTFFYIRNPTPLNAQTVIRMNKDTLYMGAVVDTEGGATVTFPEIQGDRYASIEVLDNDHYVPAVYYKPGTYKLPQDTKYAGVVVRIQVKDTNDPEELKKVNALQDQFKINASSAEPLPPYKWDTASLDALRAQYEKESAKYSSWKGMQGQRGKADEKTRHIAAAAAWGLLPEWDATYLNYNGGHDDETCYTATYNVPENDAFWSITVYGKDGYMKHENNILNSSNIKLNEDGTLTAYFGSKSLCGDVANRLDAPKGWNFLMRVYRPGESVINGEYKMPEAKPVKPYATNYNENGEIIVDESSFTIAETDRYFSDLAKEYPVNTFRHSREMSNKDNQFVVRENQDVMYSHAIVDISKGATLINPKWDVYSVIQVIDENQYTIGTIYPGEQQTFALEDVALGNHVFLNMRTAVRSLNKKGFDEAHRHQDSVRIDAASSKAYQPKGFETKSLDKTRTELKSRMAEANKPEFYFGSKDEVEPGQFLLASAIGIFGLPIKDAAYLNTIQPTGKAKEGAPSRITLSMPPLNYEKGGFISVTTYDSKGWIVKNNFALNDKTAKPNKDGSYTFNFNAPNMPNNIEVEKDWTLLIRLYAPKTVKEILEYMQQTKQNIRIELIEK